MVETVLMLLFLDLLSKAQSLVVLGNDTFTYSAQE